MFKTVVLLFAIFTVIIKVNSLECYACNGCDNLSEDQVTSCESLLPSSSTTSTTTSSTTTTITTTTSTDPTNSTTTNTEWNTISTDEPSNNNTTTTTNTTVAPYLETVVTDETVERAELSFECFTGIVRRNNTDVIIKGCAMGRANETCERFGMTSCSFCSTDKCNGVGSIQSSVTAVVLLSFGSFFKNLI